MSIKKCVNGSFVNDFYREYGTDTDTITSLPQTIIGDGQNISAWSMKGNMTQSGTPTPSNPVYPVETGEKTANLLNSDWIENGYGISNVNGLPTVASNRIATTTPIPIPTTATAISVSFSAANKIFMIYSIFRNGALIERKATQVSGATITTDNIDEMYICFYASDSSIVTKNDVSSIMVNVGAPLSYEPYGYKIPISFNQTTYNIYITEPLRKSLDGSNVYDELSSNGTLTRRVDENGDALSTPTTEQVTVPTLTTTGTPEQFNVLTTLAPSEVSLTYHGWHEHQDTKFTT